MAGALRIFLFFFGAVCAVIGLVHIGLGPSSVPGSIPGNATMDSEDRFYATLFLGFGGVARLVSIAEVGPPAPLFQVLTAVELLLPPFLRLALRRMTRKP